MEQYISIAEFMLKQEYDLHISSATVTAQDNIAEGTIIAF